MTKQQDTALIASGTVGGIKCTVGSMDFRFIGGSMGKHFGEAFLYACNYSIEKKQPLIFFCTSGGARLMESTEGGLMQMARSVLGVNELKRRNIPYIGTQYGGNKEKAECWGGYNPGSYGKYETKVLNDGWTAVTKDKSLSAQFEHTVGITEDSYEIFTESVKGYTRPPYN